MSFKPFQLIDPIDLNNILKGTSYTEFVVGWDGISAKEGTITLRVVSGSYGNIVLQSNAFVTGDIFITLPNSSGVLLTTDDLASFTSDSITTTQFYVNSANLSINTDTGVFALKALVSASLTTGTLNADSVTTDTLTLGGWSFEVI